MELEDLEPYFGTKMEICGMQFELQKRVDMGGELAEWGSGMYIVLATPNFDGIGVPVQVYDNEGNEIGTEYSEGEVTSFEEYCEIVKTLAETLIREDLAAQKARNEE